MTGKTHAACGAATMLALTVLHRSGLSIGAETYTPALGLLTVVVGSYAPDVDLKNSTLGQKLRMISHLFHHRGLTHALLFPVLLTLLMMGLKAQGMAVVPELLLGFNVGWVAHIIADAFNHKGVPSYGPSCEKSSMWRPSASGPGRSRPFCGRGSSSRSSSPSPSFWVRDPPNT